MRKLLADTLGCVRNISGIIAAIIGWALSGGDYMFQYYTVTLVWLADDWRELQIDESATGGEGMISRSAALTRAYRSALVFSH